MVTIHHTLLKQSASLGMTFVRNDNGSVELVDGGKAYSVGTPKEMMAAAIAARPKAPRAAKPKQPRAKKAGKRKASKRRSSEDGDEDGDEEDEDEEGGQSKSVVKASYKKKYRPNKDRNGDDFANKLHDALFVDEEFSMGNYTRVCRDNGIDPRKYSGLKNKDGSPNYGMMRMNVANVLRGMIRRGTPVKLGATTITKGIADLPKRAAKKAFV